MSDSPSFVSSEESLRTFYPDPSQLVIEKCLPHLDTHFRAFIAHSPFLCLATIGGSGSADISPRGDAPGFARVIDDKRLLLPDRCGNNRLDSLSNIVANPQAAVIFFVPGVDETLRVSGSAQVVRDWAPLQELTVNKKTPHTGVLIKVERAFFQCGKALKRSRLWHDDYRIDPSQIASLGRALADQTETDMTVEELDERIEDSYRDRLY